MLGFFQEKLIFHPVVLPASFNFQFNWPFKEVSVDVQGQKMHSLLFEGDKDKGTILFFHGNAMALNHWGEVAEEMVIKTKWSVQIVDYPGFGKSEGSISSEQQLHDVGSAFLTELKKSAKKIVVYGRSIGSGIATKLASENDVAGLMLESPFLNLTKLVAEIAPWAPLFLLKYRFPSDQWIKKVKCPAFIVHGMEDEVIPIEHGEQLAKVGQVKTFAPIRGAHHNDLTNYDGYWKATQAFLDTL